MRFLTMTVVFLLRMSSLKDNCLKHDQMMKYFGMKLSQLRYCLIRLGFAILFIPSEIGMCHCSAFMLSSEMASQNIPTYLGTTPHPVTVTTWIIPFLVGNPYKPSFVTVTGWGVDLKHTPVSYAQNELRSPKLKLLGPKGLVGGPLLRGPWVCWKYMEFRASFFFDDFGFSNTLL